MQLGGSYIDKSNSMDHKFGSGIGDVVFKPGDNAPDFLQSSLEISGGEFSKSSLPAAAGQRSCPRPIE